MCTALKWASLLRNCTPNARTLIAKVLAVVLVLEIVEVATATIVGELLTGAPVRVEEPALSGSLGSIKRAERWEARVGCCRRARVGGSASKKAAREC